MRKHSANPHAGNMQATIWQHSGNSEQCLWTLRSAALRQADKEKAVAAVASGAAVAVAAAAAATAAEVAIMSGTMWRPPSIIHQHHPPLGGGCCYYCSPLGLFSIQFFVEPSLVTCSGSGSTGRPRSVKGSPSMRSPPTKGRRLAELPEGSRSTSSPSTRRGLNFTPAVTTAAVGVVVLGAAAMARSLRRWNQGRYYAPQVIHPINLKYRD